MTTHPRPARRGRIWLSTAPFPHPRPYPPPSPAAITPHHSADMSGPLRAKARFDHHEPLLPVCDVDEPVHRVYGAFLVLRKAPPGRITGHTFLRKDPHCRRSQT